MVARLLGGAGIGVTLIGIALLLSLAWQYGYFGPPLQLAAATLLGTLLVAGGFWVRRQDASNIGSVALVATGVATGYLTAFMASAFYEYLPASAGMALAAALALSGLAVAASWRQQWLAAPVLFWVILLIPAMGAPGLFAAVFVLALVIASACITGNQPWLPVRISEVVPTAGVLLALTGPSLPWTALSAALVSVATAVAIWAYHRGLPTAPWGLAMMVLANLPFAHSALLQAEGSAWMLLAIAGALHTALVLLPGPRLSSVGVTGTTVGAAYLLLAGLTFSDLNQPLLWTLLLATCYLAIGLAAGGVSVWIGLALGLGGLLFWLMGRARPWDYDQLPHAYPGALDLAASLLACLVPMLALLILRRHHRAWAATQGQAASHLLGCAGLLAGSVTLLQAGVVAGRQIASGREGLSTGHIVLTTAWISLSALALARGLRSQRPMGFVYWGLALAALAVGKLFLYDLGQQPALVRAIGFLIVGVSLLVIGTRYAKALHTVRARQGPPPRPGTREDGIRPPGLQGPAPGQRPPGAEPPGR